MTGLRYWAEACRFLLSGKSLLFRDFSNEKDFNFFVNFLLLNKKWLYIFNMQSGKIVNIYCFLFYFIDILFYAY